MGASTTPNMPAGVRPVLADRGGMRAYRRRPLNSAWASIAAWSGGPIMALLFVWLSLRGLPVRRSAATTLYAAWAGLLLLAFAVISLDPAWARSHDGMLILAMHVLTPLPWLRYRHHVARVARAHMYFGGRTRVNWVFFVIPLMFGLMIESALITAATGAIG